MMKFDFTEATKGLTKEEIRGFVTMATYKHFGSILDAALGEYKEQGFCLTKASNNILELYFKDKRIAIYNFNRVTVEVIQEGCKNYMASLARSS